MKWRYTIFFALAALAGNTNAPKTIVPYDDKFADQAAALQKRGYGFDQILAELCKTALANVDKNPKLRLDDHIRSVFGGLWLWTRKGGSPSLQGRNDWAQHFIGGGTFEGYWDAGRTAAVTKEKIDSSDPSNFFDLDDLAATMLGSRWIDLATRDDGRRWIELWATGKRTLSRSLPKLNYGHLPPGQQATSEQIRAIRDAVDSALALPPG
jgi:hypothetical protein